MKPDRIIAVRNSKMVCREADRCIKLFGPQHAKADVLAEALNQARMEEIGLNVPPILEVSMIDGKWAIVSPYIRGKTLAQLMEEEPEKKETYLRLLIDLQIQVHSKTCPHLSRLKDRMNRNISRCDLDANTRFSLHARLEEMPRHSQVCHGDLTPSNILVTPDGTPYLLDWSHAAQGSAAADAAQTYLLLRLGGDAPLAAAYLKLFYEKSGLPQRSVQPWIPIAAASQSAEAPQKARALLLSLAAAADDESIQL